MSDDTHDCTCLIPVRIPNLFPGFTVAAQSDRYTTCQRCGGEVTQR